MNKLTQEDINNICTLRNEGKSLNDIATILNFSKSTVAIYLRKYCPNSPQISRRFHNRKEIHAQIIEDRLKGLTANELSIKYHLTRQTILKIIFNVKLSEEAQQLIEAKRRDKSLLEYTRPKSPEDDKIKELTDQLFELKAELANLKYNDDILAVKNFKRGMVAELFVRYKLSRKGFLVSTPLLLEEGLDLLVTTDTKTYRCEIKSTTSDTVYLIRTGYSKGTYKTENYSSSDRIDVFILVDLIRENIFFIPFDEYKKAINIGSSRSSAWKYKDYYNIFK